MEANSTPQSGAGTPVLSRVQSASEYISPSTTRRRHLPLTSSASSTLPDVSEQEIAALKRQRRRSRLMELQKPLQSPRSPDSTRAPLNNAQITEHYTNCIKLSAENKINSKNAFGLHLIEYMSELLQSRKGEMTNFQVASCTLDASAKIYAGRVDAIHLDIYKMLGGLGHGDKPANDDQVEGEDGTKTKSKKSRHSKTIETNLKNINVNKFDRGFEVDPLFEKTSASFDEGGTFGLLLNHLSSRDDTCELLLDSNIVLEEKDEKTGEAEEEAVVIDLTEFREIANGLTVDSLPIFSHFDDFEFSKIDEEVEVIKAAMGHQGDQAFDMAAVPEPLNIEEPFSAPPDHYEDFSDDDAGAGGDQFVVTSDGQEARVISGLSSCSSVSGTVSELSTQFSLQPTEYSYFDVAAMDAWAGPRHWKLKAKPQEVKKATRSSKPLFRLNYSLAQDFDKQFKETRAATTLSKATLNHHKSNHLTNILPDDIHYNPDDLFRLSHKPAITVKLIASTTEVPLDDEAVDSYDYLNENDCLNFCPDANDDDDDVDVSRGFNGDQTSLASQESIGNDSVFDITTFQGDKLVAQPHKVNKIDIQYARTAKRVDVKKLKTIMWNHLTTPSEENKENREVTVNEGSTEPEKGGVLGTQNFTDVYQALPGQLSGTMAKNLSIPIAFACLLHLANEKCLKITSSENLDDLFITQDNRGV